ncbi:hypothetical protein [Mesorhizobium carmichaelinearum]|uniref:hypothetical protein n=1 Tax=Mesorhizobium carmichaelinearum TaxID=1208188 RepID=UPI000BA323A8|nr:hypothetical protein [Mesorhizobium carmichaelinearum]
MEAYATLASAILSALAIFVAWSQFKKGEYRIDHVTSWSNDSISNLQEIYLVISASAEITNEKQKRDRLTELCINSSILIEKGRIFFKNQVINTYGATKPEAYRGYRPKILDPLVVAHEISKDWFKSDAQRRDRLARLAYENVRQFVSLAQKEVGRSKTTSADTAQGGQGVNLERLLAALK